MSFVSEAGPIVQTKTVVDDADADAALAFEEAIDGVGAHPRRENAVESARGAAPLDVSEDRGPGFESGLFLDALGEFVDVGE